MKRQDIGFRDLLERVLPLHELPPPERLRVQRALNSGIESELEHAALLTIETLEGRGALRRLPAAAGNAGTVRYQPRDGFQVITIERPARPASDGIVVCPRSSLPSRSLAGLDQVRQLLRLSDPILVGDPREGSGRDGLIAQLQNAGHELLGDAVVTFHPAGDAPDAEGTPPAADPALVRQVVAEAGTALFYCPDCWTSARLDAVARRRGMRSMVMIGVTGPGGTPLGHLEASSAEPEAFRPEDLARVALLADYCAAVMERAARIETLVFVDPLTTVYNRSYFDLQVKNELARARRDRGSVALCIADIDDFKRVNTAFGYEAGNRVLVEVAGSLRGGVRPFDTVARWGGEEFAVLLTSPVQAADAQTISERLRAAVERMSLTLEGLDRRTHQVSVTLSIGVALFPDHAESPADLWRAANSALLAAKQGRKNQVVFYRPPETTD
jgi:diguanylate cyclase (GGDEF)-like protein